MADFVNQTIALPDDVREASYREIRTNRSMVERARRDRNRLGAIFGVFGSIALAVSGAGWVYVLSRDTTIIKVIEINHATETVGYAHNLDDVPHMLDESMIQGALFDYVNARERYAYQVNALDWTQVRAMSNNSVFSTYDTEQKSRDSAKMRLGKTGEVKILGDIRFIDALKSPTGTTSYKFQFKRQEYINDSPATPELCNGGLSFQIRPEIMQYGLESHLNPKAVQVVEYEPVTCKFIKDGK